MSLEQLKGTEITIEKGEWLTQAINRVAKEKNLQATKQDLLELAQQVSSQFQGRQTTEYALWGKTYKAVSLVHAGEKFSIPWTPTQAPAKAAPVPTPAPAKAPAVATPATTTEKVWNITLTPEQSATKKALKTWVLSGIKDSDWGESINKGDIYSTIKINNKEIEVDIKSIGAVYGFVWGAPILDKNGKLWKVGDGGNLLSKDDFLVAITKITEVPAVATPTAPAAPAAAASAVKAAPAPVPTPPASAAKVVPTPAPVAKPTKGRTGLD